MRAFSLMGGVLRAESLWVETFTGLRMRQFERLLEVVRERGGDGPRWWSSVVSSAGGPGSAGGRVLPDEPHDAAARAAVRLLAGDVCRVIQRLRPLWAIEPATRPADVVERLWIVAGTLVPVRDRKAGASSRNYRFSANVQVIIDADTTLVIAAARPVPGNTADAKAWRDSGLAAACEGVTVLADGACINSALVVPHRKRPGGALLSGEEEDNAKHRRVRARVEHAFARMKHYKILRDCRQRGTGLHHAVQAVAHMHNLAMAA